MPYDPKAITEEERTNQFKLLWVGLPASLINIAWLIFFPEDTTAPNLFGVFAGATLGFMVFAHSYDEFIQAHLWTAARWALGAAGIMILIGVFPMLNRLQLLAEINLILGLSVIAAVFHVALAVSRLRERWAE